MPHISTLDLEQDFGKFILEPLERGYGQTIGNTLRRVLLSSIQGAAICAVRIDKVFHEFAPIPGLKEDTTELLLNLKDLAIEIDVDGTTMPDEKTITIDVKGPGRVTGADVVCPEGVRIVNPEAYIATISDSKATFSMEMKVRWGVGYILPEKQEDYKGVIGLIPTGAQFTPVRKVNYTVEQTRVGTRTDYERLVLEVWTNGAIKPNDAISQAAHILDRYFKMFFDLGAPGFEDEVIGEDDLTDELRNVPEIRIEELDFSQRTFNCLRRAGLLNLRSLAVATESDLTSIRGFGKKSLVEVRDKLHDHGLELKPPKGGYRPFEAFDDEDEEDF
ncbi:MAG: DNA-directed RNA polymerase subunit alpha [Fimbriimonas ginsengisoli]|uniref:DNA-directed RNA polymerase subunit alpha n=1 Tax=Fimbriimonas ginsengisoli TaxID=1005039 RepID=A0A931PX87_FIMGI|nr:DNA-directed RNA polymerase subunit alpha [Fimbriimonas ginsengisoli]